MKELIEYHAKEAKKLDWEVITTGGKIELYSRFKNGKLRKTPSMEISYEEYILEQLVDVFGDVDFIEEKRKSTRPWHVGAKSFNNPQHAFQAFLDQAIELAPEK